MEKLESILLAEDEARDAVVAAREAAQTTLSEARARAARDRADTIAAARERATAESDAALAAARDEASGIAAAANAQEAAMRTLAESRMHDAVESVVSELVG